MLRDKLIKKKICVLQSETMNFFYKSNRVFFVFPFLSVQFK